MPPGMPPAHRRQELLPRFGQKQQQQGPKQQQAKSGAAPCNLPVSGGKKKSVYDGAE
jgi:hypothetical protein